MQARGYIPSSVYTTSTQYRMQRYPTFSVRGYLPQRLADDGSPSASVNASSCGEVGSHHEERCTYQANTSHLSTSISSTGEPQVNDGVAITPFATSGYIQVSSSDRRSELVGDQSQYVSSCHSHTATFRHYESCVCHGTSHTLSSNFYSMSSHHSRRSTHTMPASAAAHSHHMPGRSFAINAGTSHSVTAAQHRQNVIEVSKPFESSDVLRYSEKLRRQRLNNSAMAPADFCNLSH